MKMQSMKQISLIMFLWLSINTNANAQHLNPKHLTGTWSYPDGTKRATAKFIDNSHIKLTSSGITCTYSIDTTQSPNIFKLTTKVKDSPMSFYFFIKSINSNEFSLQAFKIQGSGHEKLLEKARIDIWRRKTK